MSWRRLAVGGGVLGAALLACALLVPAIWIVSLASSSEPAPVSETSPPDRSTLPIAAGPARSPPPGVAAPVPESRSAFEALGPEPHAVNRHARELMRSVLTGQLAREIAALRPRLDACPDPLPHPERPSAVELVGLVQRQLSGAPEPAGDSPTVLMLDVDTFDGQVKVAGAAVAIRGGATDAFLACAQQVLRGQILFVPGAAGGEHLKVPVDLTGGAQASGQRHVRRRR